MYAKKPFDAAPRSQKIITRTIKKIPSDRSKILIFLTLVQWACLLNFAQISPHGTAKEEYGIILVIIFRLHRLPCYSYRYPFLVLDTDTSLCLYVLRQGDGYHVIIPENAEVVDHR
jgi:hypothetical protein